MSKKTKQIVAVTIVVLLSPVLALPTFLYAVYLAVKGHVEIKAL